VKGIWLLPDLGRVGKGRGIIALNIDFVLNVQLAHPSSNLPLLLMIIHPWGFSGRGSTHRDNSMCPKLWKILDIEIWRESQGLSQLKSMVIRG
jgi:hypothetical protein